MLLTDKNKSILEKITTKVEQLKNISDTATFDTAILPKILSELNNEYSQITYNKTTGGAPLRFGSSSSKTNRNRRRNRRFAKKSYKRRR